MTKTTRIRNGVIQTPTGPVEADVLVDGERISALLGRDSAVTADTDIDASDLWVTRLAICTLTYLSRTFIGFVQ